MAINKISLTVSFYRRERTIGPSLSVSGLSDLVEVRLSLFKYLVRSSLLTLNVGILQVVVDNTCLMLLGLNVGSLIDLCLINKSFCKGIGISSVLAARCDHVSTN